MVLNHRREGGAFRGADLACTADERGRAAPVHWQVGAAPGLRCQSVRALGASGPACTRDPDGPVWSGCAPGDIGLAGDARLPL
jgi:hypothetical protein